MNRWMLLMVVGVVGCSSTYDRVPRGQRSLTEPADLPDVDAIQAVVTRTNAERHRAGLAPLSVDPRLTDAAERHARNMARQNRMSHSLDGRTVVDRVRAAGYEYRTVGENVAWNQSTASAVVSDWMSSRGHRRNILSPDFIHIGVAVATNSKGEPYWAQVFGSPK